MSSGPESGDSGRTLDDDILRDVLELVTRHFGRPASSLVADTRLREDLQADSLNMIELLVLAEDRFGVVVTDAEASALETVGDVAALVSARC